MSDELSLEEVAEEFDSFTLGDEKEEKELEETYKEITETEEIINSSLNETQEELNRISKAKITNQYIPPDDSDLSYSLYNEFSSFMQHEGGMTQDVGTKNVIPTGLDVLDYILGGGFPVGALSMIIGSPGCGKSMLVGQILANGQKLFNKDNKFISAYLDSETSTTTKRLADLGVVNPYIRPYNDLTAEKVFKMIEGLCTFKIQKDIIDVPSILIWDSIANTLSQKEMEAEDINSVLGYRQRLYSMFIPKYVTKINKANIALISINQLRDKISLGPFAPAKDLKYMKQGKDIPGGNAIKFNCFTLLEMKIIGEATTDKEGFEGQIVLCRTLKNKFFPPDIPVSIVGDFTKGFDNFWTSFLYLKNTERLKTGAWNYLKNYSEKKFRTKEAKDLYLTDLEFKTKFDEALKEALENEIGKKYNI